MNIARVVLHVAAEPPKNRTRTLAHAGYVREILAHAGFFFNEITRSQLAVLPSPSRGGVGGEVLLLVGDAALTQDEVEALEAWIEAGACLIPIGSPPGAPWPFGVAR